MIRPFQVASNIGVAETEQVLDRPSICLWVSGCARIRLQPLDRTCLAAMLGRTFPPKCWTSFTEFFRTWFFVLQPKRWNIRYRFFGIKNIGFFPLFVEVSWPLKTSDPKKVFIKLFFFVDSSNEFLMKRFLEATASVVNVVIIVDVVVVVVDVDPGAVAAWRLITLMMTWNFVALLKFVAFRLLFH